MIGSQKQLSVESEPTKDYSRLHGLGRKLTLPLLLTVLTFAALSAYGDAKQILDRLLHFHYPHLLVALALSFGNYLVRALRWQFYLRYVGVRVPHFESGLVFLAGLVMTITPGKVGEVFKSFLLKWTRDTPIAESSPIVIAERVTDLIALLLLSAWGAALLPRGAWLSGLCLVLALGVVLLTTWKWLGELCLKIAAKLPYFRTKVDRLLEAYRGLLTMMRPGPLLISTALAVFAWFLQVLVVKWIVMGLPQGQIDVQAAALAYCAPLLAGVVVLLPGGIGVTEAGMAGLLQLSGGLWAKPAATATVTILARLATLWFAVLVGAVALFFHHRLTGWSIKEEPD